MDASAAKERISRLGRHDFADLVFKLFQAEYGEHVRQYKGLENHALVRELPQGPEGSELYGQYEGVYLIQDVPIELFREPETIEIRTSFLEEQLLRVRQDYADRVFYFGPFPEPISILQSIYFLNNISGLSPDFHRDILLPKYVAIARQAGVIPPEGVYMGNVDAFLDVRSDLTIRVLTEFLEKNFAGLSIELTDDRRSVRHFSSDKYLTAGVSRESLEPYDPIYLPHAEPLDSLLVEFEELIARNPTESALETFLTRHYREIFGMKYDRIETQVWLRFPELDINRKKRRLDLFLRNAVAGDWELYELKRIVPLTSTYRDMPVIAHEICNAIQQVRNYERILQQQQVKDMFAREGIEYFEPTLHLVAGRTPDVSHKQWRALLAHNTDRVKLLTYDDLLKEMRLRFSEQG